MTEEERRKRAAVWFESAITRAYLFAPDDPGKYFAQDIGYPEAGKKFREIFKQAEKEGDG